MLFDLSLVFERLFLRFANGSIRFSCNACDLWLSSMTDEGVVLFDSCLMNDSLGRRSDFSFFLGVTSADGVEDARSGMRFCEGFSKDLFAI